MRREELYLRDIIETADEIEQFLIGMDEGRFLQDKLVRSAVLQKLTVIGEAAARLSKEFRDRHSDIIWRRIISFRNIAVHAYFAIQWSIVWVAATHDAPVLKQQVVKILTDEFPQTGLP